MKSLRDILVHILHDCGMRCGANPCRDILYVTRRTDHEGDSFLTITLPSFAQGLERGLEEGSLSPALFSKFSFRKGTRCPRFLGGFVERVFGPDGVLLAQPSSDCIFAIRQICLFAKKLKLPCTSRRERAAEEGYVDIERELRSHAVPQYLSRAFRSVSGIVWSDVLLEPEFTGSYEELTPKHGPGTTVEGIRGNGKFHFPSWPSRLEREFPYTEFGLASVRNIVGAESLLSFPDTQLQPRNETPVKVVFVPKTQKRPRVIAMEPVCMQYVQQSIASWLLPRIEQRGRYSAGHVNFRDQQINASLALDGSRSQFSATLDMSEASDRVSSRLVADMLSHFPAFRRRVFSCRSTRATLPSGVTLPLRKFASMGSALCFPMEAMAFYIAIITHRILASGNTVCPSAVFKYSRGVFVYGDDLVVPVNEAPAICETLESFGFKVNRHKSFWAGKFRESCGMDAYDGTDVTPTYVRRTLPVDRTDCHGIASTVALANHFYLKGLWQTAKFLRTCVEQILGKLPSISRSASDDLDKVIDGKPIARGSAGLGWISFSNAESFNGWHEHYQCLKSRRWVVQAIRRRDPLGDDAALLKCFGLIGSKLVDPDHLTRSVRYGNLALKRRWVAL